MGISLENNYVSSLEKTKSGGSLWSRFIQWSDKQEEHRFGWTAAAIAGHGCIITILTLLAVILSGNNFIFWPFVIAAMAASLLTNLAAMPTKITVPVFFISILVDLVIIGICIGIGLDFAAMYP